MAPAEPIVQLARVPGRVPRVDVAIAAGLLVWALLEALLAQGPGSTGVRVALAAAFSVPLVVRRRHPAAALLIVAGAALARGALEGPLEQGAMPFPSLLLASFSAALYAQPRALAIAAAPVPIAVMPFAGFGGMELPSLIALSVAAWTAGWLIRRRAAQVAREHAAAPGRARRAIADERSRMARELHDLVAHSVTVISIQAGAADGLLARDAAAARGHLEAVRRAAGEALDELRRLVSVLRRDEAPYAPQPGLDRLGDLIAETRAAGVPVRLHEEGERPAMPAGLELAAYRIVQEALTNVRRHAGGATADVRVRYAPDRLRLEITDGGGHRDGALAPGTGQGLIGLRERARLYGGQLSAGPDGAGFRVTAELPLDAAAHAPEDGPADPVPAAGTPRAAGPRPVGRADVLLALALAAWGVTELVVTSDGMPAAGRVLVVLGCAGAVLLRRRLPVAALIAASALLTARSLAFDAVAEETMPFVALLLTAFSAPCHARSLRPAVAALAVALAGVGAGVLAAGLDSPPAVDIAILSGITAGAWTAGLLARRRSAQLALARAQAPVLRRAAVLAERERIARELHDIVAHHVATVPVQAAAAMELLERDPAAAREHVRAIQDAARGALGEMRRVLGVLRDEQAEYAPQPGLARLPELVEAAQRAGHPVELREEGERGEVGPGTDLAAYRLAEEALDAVRAAPAVLRVRYAELVELSVESAAPPNGGDDGPGLAGMRERARVYGGSVEAGRGEGGGYVVTARLPR